MLRGLYALFTPLQETPQHMLPAMHPKTHHDSETPPAWAPYSQHSHVLRCAHRFLCTYLCTHTHANTCTYYLHVYLCSFTSAHMHMSLHTHTCIQASSPSVCANIHSCAHTHMLTEMLVHGHIFTGTHGDVLTCREARVCTQLCTHTHMYVLTHIYTHVCTPVYMQAHTLHT